MIGIYKITNKTNNKVYIGQSINIEQRWKTHLKKSRILNTPLYQAMRKDGIENFLFEVIEECNQEQLNNKEKYWINYYNSTNSNKGYNILKGTHQNNNNNNLSKRTYNSLTLKQVEEIKDKLKNTNITMVQLAKEYKCSDMAISYINQGYSWYNSKDIYPLRSKPVITVIKKDGIEQIITEHNEYYCIDCGKQLNRKGTLRCQNCEIENRRKNSVVFSYITREELKKLIRTLPFTTIGKQYNVSDNTIRKWCKRYNLPYRKKDINSYSDEDWDKI